MATEMTTAIKTEIFKLTGSGNEIEKRTYKNGKERWYEKGYFKYYRMEESTAERWLNRKIAVPESEYEKVKKYEDEMLMLRFYLRLAQKIGNVKSKWERENVDV